jgi:predicted SnoaL-like aldol condensation-catalyzing enzyme
MYINLRSGIKSMDTARRLVPREFGKAPRVGEGDAWAVRFFQRAFALREPRIRVRQVRPITCEGVPVATCLPARSNYVELQRKIYT